MDEKLKNKLLRGWFENDDRKLATTAIERIEGKNPFAFVREKTDHGKSLDEDELFGDIDKMIKFLTNLKKEGYSAVNQIWHGYEDNDFIAEKIEDETDEEMCSRFYRIIYNEMDAIDIENDKKAKKELEIAKLKQRISELERGL